MFNGFKIPAGVCTYQSTVWKLSRYAVAKNELQSVVGMSSWMMHRNEAAFPIPEKFDPERWIENGTALDKYLVAFSKGSRSCIGMKYVYSIPATVYQLGKLLAILTGAASHTVNCTSP
jgi:Cytochrome P450